MTRLTRRLLTAAAVAAWCGVAWYLGIRTILAAFR